jgi:hypothetical protein
MILKFSRQIFEKYSNIIFMKIRLVGKRIFHTHVQRKRTDLKQLTVAVLNFSEKPKKTCQRAACSQSDFNQFNNKVNGCVMKERRDTASGVH